MATIEGSTSWGQADGVQEGNVRTFSGNWTGTGFASGSGNYEKMYLSSTAYMESEVVNTGANSITLVKNKYAPEKYLSKVGSFNIDTSKVATETQSISGVGFQPKIVLFWWSGGHNTGDELAGGSYSTGFGTAISSTSRFSVTSFSIDGNETSSCYGSQDTSNCIKVFTAYATIDGIADFSAMTTDGFDLIIDNQFSIDYRISYLALGGDDLTNVYIGNKQTPVNLGNYNVTGVGFQPDALITCTAFGTAITQNRGGGGYALGIGTSAKNQGIAVFTSYSGAATSNTRGYGYNGEIIGFYSRQSFVEFIADGFTLNHLEYAGEQIYYYFICLKGGQYKVHELTTRTDGNDIVESDVGFTPVALLFASANRALSTQDLSSDHARFSIGGATSVSERACAAISDEDNLAVTETAFSNYDTAVYSNIVDDANAGLMDLKSIDSNGFTAVMDTPDISENWVTYLAMGANANPAILKYRSGSSVVDCQGSAWQTYSGSFTSLGYTQVRVEGVNKWWLANGVVAGDVVAAYQAKGAGSYANSLENLVDDTYTLVDTGHAPDWDDTNGWKFDGISEYLDTGIADGLELDNYTLIARYSNLSLAEGNAGYVCGLVDSSQYFYIGAYNVNIGDDKDFYGYGAASPAEVIRQPYSSSAVKAIVCGVGGYHNGVIDSQVAVNSWFYSTPAYILIGCIDNYSDSPANFTDVYVQALAVYNKTLTPTQIAAITDNMEAL